MNGLTNEVTLARNVGLRAVHAYLRTNGWVRAGSASRDTADVYLWPEDNREAAIVPASEEYADFGTRIYQIAEQIGRIEGRKRLAVLADLSIAESDLVRVHLPNAHADNTVRLTDGAAVLKEAKKLLLAAACSADRPQRMYRSGTQQGGGGVPRPGTLRPHRAGQLRDQPAFASGSFAPGARYCPKSHLSAGSRESSPPVCRHRERRWTESTGVSQTLTSSRVGWARASVQIYAGLSRGSPRRGKVLRCPSAGP